MIRRNIQPRPDWEAKVEEHGLYWHHTDEGQYWDESVCYEFTEDEIDQIYDTTENLHDLCMKAVEEVIKKDRLGEMGILPAAHAKIKESWASRDPHLYGRFDLSFNPKTKALKMLEYNADTPTTLLEASVIQWHWKEAVFKNHDQFNSLEEDLIKRWEDIHGIYRADKYHFTCEGESEEDYATVHYLMDCLKDIFPIGNSRTQFVGIEDIGWNDEHKVFLDLPKNEITHLFKLYPLEWIIDEEFSKHLLAHKMKLIEPYWKLILSNKAILPILWEMAPNHPNLLPAYFTEDKLLDRDRVIKPFFSREGSSIDIIRNGAMTPNRDHKYASTYSIFQEYFEQPKFDGRTPVIGSWVIGDKASGIGIREDLGEVTSNFSRFIPHCFIPRS